MAKITVEAAAKRLGMDPESCLKRLQEMGMLVRDQLDQIDLETFRQVKARLEEEKMRAQTIDAHTSKRIGSRVIRRRRIKTSDMDSATDLDEGAEVEAAAEPEEFSAPESHPAIAAEEPAPEALAESEPVVAVEQPGEQPSPIAAMYEAVEVPPAPSAVESAAPVETPINEAHEAQQPHQEPLTERDCLGPSGKCAARRERCGGPTSS